MSQRPLDQPVTIVASALLPTFLQDPSEPFNPAWEAAWSTADSPAIAASLQLLSRAQVHERHTLPKHSRCAPHEWAYAQAMDWPGEQGLLPFAAERALQRGLTCPADQGWAFIDLVHWEVNQGQVHLSSVGEVTPAEDQAVFQAMLGYFEEDGIGLYPERPGRWLARASHFKQQPSASLARVLDQDIAYWLDPDSVAAQSPSQRLLRRLQNEMQMLLYTHAINDRRPLAINSFWWSGTGDLPQPGPRQVVLNTDLQAPRAAQDPTAWGACWQQLARDLMAPALLAGHRLILCGEDRLMGLQSPSHGLWQGLIHKVLRPDLKKLLT